MGSSKTCTELYELELEILERGDEMTPEEARKFQKSLISCYKDFVKHQRNNFKHYQTLDEIEYLKNSADFVQNKTIRLEERLRRFISPTDSMPVSLSQTDSKVISLTSLQREQKFYIRMIDSSLKSDEDIQPKEAEIRLKHLNQFYEKFIANQCKIATLIEDALFDDHIENSKKVEQKVVEIQSKLETTIKTTSPVPESVVNGNFNRIEGPRVIADFLDSLLKKQKSLIEQIEWIESKVNPGRAEAETLHDHLSKLYDSFVKNQTRIENYVSDSTLDDQLKKSREMLQNVVSLQTKLKSIFEPISASDDRGDRSDTAEKKCSDADDLNALLEKQNALIDEIESLDHDLLEDHKYCSRQDVEYILDKMDQLIKSFDSNHWKIAALYQTEQDIEKQNKISQRIRDAAWSIQNRYIDCEPASASCYLGSSSRYSSYSDLGSDYYGMSMGRAPFRPPPSFGSRKRFGGY